MGRIAAIDYGDVRLGIAITDPMRVIASPLTVVECAGSADHKATVVTNALKSMVPIDLIVVGLPLLMNGAESPMSSKARLFARALQPLFPHIEVILWDERLSSMQADRLLKEEGGLRRKERAKKVDALSAALILQSYLLTL